MNYDDWKLRTPPQLTAINFGKPELTAFQKAIACPYNKSHKKRIEALKKIEDEKI